MPFHHARSGRWIPGGLTSWDSAPTLFGGSFSGDGARPSERRVSLAASPSNGSNSAVDPESPRPSLRRRSSALTASSSIACILPILEHQRTHSEPARAPKALDTQTQWTDYTSKVSLQQQRRPHWPRRVHLQADDSAPADEGFLQRRRALQKQIREAGVRAPVREGLKRDLVQGPMASENSARHWASEHRRIETHRLQIKEAIRGCSRARHELAGIRRVMAELSPGMPPRHGSIWVPLEDTGVT
mmetsp:Transcript_16716/g.47564  ORF Transcript_16716/g.47564 Transcript_16716/m.47564 type:complete len:244 (-) Transcript_16716:133-864(-)